VDAYFDMSMPMTFTPDRTLAFGSANTTLQPPNSPACGSSYSFHLVIDETVGATNPSDAYYGPWMNLNLDVNSGMATSMGNGFLTHPYNPSNFATGMSMGNLTGHKN
jgi:hypothetical protein